MKSIYFHIATLLCNFCFSFVSFTICFDGRCFEERVGRRMNSSMLFEKGEFFFLGWGDGGFLNSSLVQDSSFYFRTLGVKEGESCYNFLCSPLALKT